MIPFEERFTAWVDGKLSGDDLEAFEKEMSARPEVLADKKDCLKMGALLRAHSTVPKLSNPDFFSLQLLQRIAAEAPIVRKPADKPALFWSFRRLVFAGGVSLALAFGLYKTMIPAGAEAPKLAQKPKVEAPVQRPENIASNEEPGEREYYAQVVESRVSDPDISVSTVYDAEQKMTVLWIDGLGSVPARYAEK